MCFVRFSQTANISLNSVNQLIFVMVKRGVFFAVRTEFLNIIYASFGFKGLKRRTKTECKMTEEENWRKVAEVLTLS
jgi:hypothetical protein